MQLQVLSKVLACGLGAGSAACLALKQAADAGDLASPAAQRLQLGLMGFSSGEGPRPVLSVLLFFYRGCCFAVHDSSGERCVRCATFYAALCGT
jgi:hypothetical protein